MEKLYAILILSAYCSISTFAQHNQTQNHTKPCIDCKAHNISIYVDDVEIREFSCSQKNYKRVLPFGSKKIPTVKANFKTSKNSEILKITQADSLNGIATIDISNSDKYTITFEVAKKPVLKLQYPEITDVKIDDVFWNKYLSTFFKTTIPYSFKKFEEQGSIRHFQGIINGKPKAENNPWLDGLFFEVISASGNFLLTNKNDNLEKLIDSYIDTVFKASKTSPTGYLSTHVMIKEPNKFFDANKNALFLHDAYNFGTMVEAGLNYYKATKKPKLLYVACRFAEFIVANYGYGNKADGTPKINMVPSHELAEETLLCLYQYLKNNPELVKTLNNFDTQYPLNIKPERYADLVKFWIENRGNYDRREHNTNYGEYAQDHKYYFDQERGEGHAVRANLFYTAMVAAGLEFDNNTYISTADKIWQNIYKKQMYVNGSVGAIGGTESYACDYILPNDGYCETCASVAYGFACHYLTSAHGESDYADVMELEMYNSILGCINPDGNKFFYKNPINIKNHNRWDWHVCACCPPMLLKFYSQLQKYIYSYNDSEVYINQFISSSAKFANGVEIVQSANMPWNGKVQIKISKSTKLKIRIPSWTNCKRPKILVNNKNYDYTTDKGYAVVDVKSNDIIDFEIELTARKIHTPKVPFNKGKVALAYGPIIYTVELVDNPHFVDSQKDFSGAIPKDAKLDVQFEKNTLGGIYTITTTALDKSSNEKQIKAIPYYIRGNRGATGQYMWIAEK